MGSSEQINNFAFFLLTQGAGGLFLVLICLTLYWQRRRAYFLIWTLSWLSFSLEVLSRASFLAASPGIIAVPWWVNLVNLPVWLHGLLWGVGLWCYLRGCAAAPPVGHRGSRRAVALTGAAVAAVAALAAAGSGFLSWAWHNLLLAAFLASVYAAGAACVLFAHLRRVGLGRLVLGGALAASAVWQLALAWPFLTTGPAQIALQLPPLYLPFLDFLLQAFNILGMILVLLGEDESVLRQTLQRLAESESRSRILFEHGGAGLALLSPDGAIVEANPALEEMLGYGPGQLVGQRLSGMAHVEDRSDFTLRVKAQTVSTASDQTERETRYERRDGGLIWARVVRAVVRDDEGAVRYHASVLMNVTEQRRAEEALRQAQEIIRHERDFVSLMLQTADALIVVVDSDGRIVRFNQKCAVVSGYTEAEAQGRVFWTFLLPERFVDSTREGFMKGMTPAANSAAVPLEIPWRTRTGGERLIAWRQSLVREESGFVKYAIGVGLDVTEQRRLEEQLRPDPKTRNAGDLGRRHRPRFQQPADRRDRQPKPGSRRLAPAGRAGSGSRRIRGDEPARIDGKRRNRRRSTAPI